MSDQGELFQEQCAVCGSSGAEWLCDHIIGWKKKLDQNALAAANPKTHASFPGRWVVDSDDIEGAAFTCDLPLCSACTHKSIMWTHFDPEDRCPIHCNKGHSEIVLMDDQEASAERSRLRSCLKSVVVMVPA